MLVPKLQVSTASAAVMQLTRAHIKEIFSVSPSNLPRDGLLRIHHFQAGMRPASESGDDAEPWQRHSACGGNQGTLTYVCSTKCYLQVMEAIILRDSMYLSIEHF